MTSGAAHALTEALALVLPADCAGCGAWDQAVCPRCRDLVSRTPVRCDGQAPMLDVPGDGSTLLPVWSLADYAGPVRPLVLAWKRAGRADVARVLLARARLGAQAWAADPELVLDGDGDVLVVPAPSGLRRRLRGMLVVADLADAVAAGVAASGALAAGRRVRSADVLRRSGGHAHQAGLGARARARNRTTGVSLVAAPTDRDVVVLVDDVLTTGATLATCSRVLAGAGARVAGALVLAATPPPGRSGGPRAP